MYREVPVCSSEDGPVNEKALASVFPCLAVVTVRWRLGEAISPKAMAQHLP